MILYVSSGPRQSSRDKADCVGGIVQMLFKIVAEAERRKGRSVRVKVRERSELMGRVS